MREYALVLSMVVIIVLQLTTTSDASAGPNSMDDQTSQVNLHEKYPFRGQVLTDLEAKYGYASLYFKYLEKCYTVLTDSLLEDYSYEDNPLTKFGLLVGTDQLLIPVEYDFIGSLNGVAKNCMELKKEGKYGLYNVKNGQTLAPQFEQLLPGSDHTVWYAYGQKGGKWYSVDGNSFALVLVDPFNPIKHLAGKYLNLHQFDGIPLNWVRDENAWEGDWTSQCVILPAYISEFSQFDNSLFNGTIIPYVVKPEVLDQIRQEVDVVSELDFEITLIQQISEKITSFFTSFNNYGIMGRSYGSVSNSIASYNSQNGQVQQIELNIGLLERYFCEGPTYSFVQDTIFQKRREVEVYMEDHDNIKYNVRPTYELYVVRSNGDIVPLSSKRSFNFTEHILIDSTYFMGCYGVDVPEPEASEKGRVLRSDHLSIRDLDIMRNEIFASYGYRFKRQEWADFFGSQSWYKPEYENVDHLLTAVDKANIKVILATRKRLELTNEAILNRRYQNDFKN